MNNSNSMDIAIISTYDTDYIRMIVNNLSKKGYLPKNIYFANKVSQIMFKFNSFTRIVKRLGLTEAILRIYNARKTKYSIEKKEYTSIHELSKTNNIKIDYYDHVKSGKLLTKLLANKPKIIVLAGCGMVDNSLISIPTQGCINAHPAILPGARGVDVVDWSLLNNYPFGVTAHMVDVKVDAGDIIKVREVNSDKSELYDDFKHRLLEDQAKVMADAIIEVYEEKANFTKHDLTKSKLYFSITNKEKIEAKKIFSKITKAIS